MGETENEKEERLENRVEDLRFKLLCRDIAHVKDLLFKELDRIEQLRDQGEISREDALKLKADEYKVHFEKLNHEAEQLKSMQATYTLKEVSEKAEKLSDDEFKKIRSEMASEFFKLRENELGPLKTWQSHQDGKNRTMLSVWGVIMLLISAAIGLIFKMF